MQSNICNFLSHLNVILFYLFIFVEVTFKKLTGIVYNLSFYNDFIVCMKYTIRRVFFDLNEFIFQTCLQEMRNGSHFNVSPDSAYAINVKQCFMFYKTIVFRVL